MFTKQTSSDILTNRHNLSVREQIIGGVRLAIFASEYADAAEEAGYSMQGEIMDQLPEDIDPETDRMAELAITRIEQKRGLPIEELYVRYPFTKYPEEMTPRIWGHYFGMQALGHGVGLWEYGITNEMLDVPYVGSCGLANDYDFESGALIKPAYPRMSYDEFCEQVPSIAPHIIADSIGANRKETDFLVDKLLTVCYHNEAFLKRCKSAKGRDHIYAFMEHWKLALDK